MAGFALVALVELVASGACSVGSEPALPPPGVAFDYQLGGDYSPPEGVELVVRQWTGEAVAGAYSVCYVNAFQTEAEPGHPDHATSWPGGLVLEHLEDPDWPGEHPIDISNDGLRETAVEFVARRFAECEAHGFDAIELDNLDTFTRYPDAPFDRDDAIAYARLLVEEANDLGLAVGQKNTPELLDVAGQIGFGFAIVEECGQYRECEQFVDAYEGRVYDVEYTGAGLAAACEAVGDVAGVLRRDLDLVTPEQQGYLRATC